jgi:hypothetical protein
VPAVRAATAATAATGPPGRLLLAGCSEMFKDSRLYAPEARADRLLLNAVAAAALPPELAALAGRRRVAPGLGYVSVRRRLALRLAVTAGPPLLLLLAGAGRWRLWRRRSARGAA